MNEGNLKQNYEYRALARKQLKGKWAMAALVMLISWILLHAFTNRGYSYVDGHLVPTSPGGIYYFALLISFLLSGPINYGIATYFMKISRSTEPLLEDMFGGFKYFVNTFLLNLLKGIFIVLWTMLLFVPGIIAALRYSMAYYIMNDNPGMDAMEAIKQSKEMMKGHKGKLFKLTLSFIGWSILSIFTLGIGYLWVGAYYNTAIVNLYEDLKGNNMNNNVSEII